MRTELLWAGVAMMLAGSSPALAGGRGAADICTGAGYRSGTVAFDMCLSRVGGDDPLSALEESDDISRVAISGKRAADDSDALAALEHGKGVAIQMVRVPARNGDLQSFGNNLSFGGGGAPVPGGGAGGGLPGPAPGGGFPGSVAQPAPPTAPTAPTLPFTGVPVFNFGD